MSAEVVKARSGGPEDTQLREVQVAYHPELDSHGVRVGLEFASVSDESRAKGRGAVRLHGRNCHAVVRITNERERRYGAPDAVVTFDRHSWDANGADWRDAVLDHELTHLEIATAPDGTAKLDRQLRPKLKMRLHDVEVGWFREVAARHGLASEEVRQVRSMLAAEVNTQSLFSFMTDDELITLADRVRDARSIRGEEEESDAPALSRAS